MNRLEALRGVRSILMAGYGHYSRAEERRIFDALLLQTIDEIPKPVREEIQAGFVLAGQPLRSLKNSLICGIAVLCRHAADLGADDARCYALSDYLIREIEDRFDARSWQQTGMDIIRQYAALVAEGRQKNYSLPVVRTVRFVGQHLYEPVTVQGIAREVGVHPNYLSSRFREETGTPLRVYIRNRKMEEAKNLLRDTSHTISEIAEMLGYCNVSYFGKVFRQVYGHAPGIPSAGQDEAPGQKNGPIRP